MDLVSDPDIETITLTDLAEKIATEFNLTADEDPTTELRGYVNRIYSAAGQWYELPEVPVIVADEAAERFRANTGIDKVSRDAHYILDQGWRDLATSEFIRHEETGLVNAMRSFAKRGTDRADLLKAAGLTDEGFADLVARVEAAK